MCSAPGVTGRGHCAWRRGEPSARDPGDAGLARPISEVYESSRGIYGAPKAHMELRRRGFRTSRKRVARIMRDDGWSGTARGCARRPKGPPEAAAPQAGAAPGLVGRDFTADGPDKARFADITYVRARRGRLHLAPVMGIWSRRIVGCVNVNLFFTDGTAVVILDQEKVTRRTACTAQSSAGWQSRPSSGSTTATPTR